VQPGPVRHRARARRVFGRHSVDAGLPRAAHDFGPSQPPEPDAPTAGRTKVPGSRVFGLPCAPHITGTTQCPGQRRCHLHDELVRRLALRAHALALRSGRAPREHRRFMQGSRSRGSPRSWSSCPEAKWRSSARRSGPRSDADSRARRRRSTRTFASCARSSRRATSCSSPRPEIIPQAIGRPTVGQKSS
jgi:hypothetical protein